MDRWLLNSHSHLTICYSIIRPLDYLTIVLAARFNPMFGIDTVTLLVMIGALVVLLLLLDFLMAGGGMTGALMGGMMQCGAAVLGSPYGWVLVLTLVVIILALFGIYFR